jgi:hypothetical protein
LSKFDL